MPLLISALLGGLVQILGSLIGRILLALAIGYVSYKGFDALLTQISGIAKANLNVLPGDVVSFLKWCWVDRGINMIASSYTAAITIKLANSDSFTRMIVKK